MISDEAATGNSKTSFNQVFIKQGASESKGLPDGLSQSEFVVRPNAQTIAGYYKQYLVGQGAIKLDENGKIVDIHKPFVILECRQEVIAALQQIGITQCVLTGHLTNKITEPVKPIHPDLIELAKGLNLREPQPSESSIKTLGVNDILDRLPVSCFKDLLKADRPDKEAIESLAQDICAQRQPKPPKPEDVCKAIERRVNLVKVLLVQNDKLNLQQPFGTMLAEARIQYASQLPDSTRRASRFSGLFSSSGSSSGSPKQAKVARAIKKYDDSVQYAQGLTVDQMKKNATDFLRQSSQSDTNGYVYGLSPNITRLLESDCFKTSPGDEQAIRRTYQDLMIELNAPTNVGHYLRLSLEQLPSSQPAWSSQASPPSPERK